VIVHLNGLLLPIEEATISPLDRGFIFGDGVYEGLRAEHGRIVSLPRHLARLRQSLRLTSIEGFDPESLEHIVGEILEANGLTDAFIYFQITRGTPPPGAPPRERRPSSAIRPTVFAYAQAEAPVRTFTRPRTVRAITHDDPRWTLGHIKAISLLPNVMASIDAANANADDAIFVRGDRVAEGTATNVFVVKGGRIATPSLESTSFLAGVPRDVLCDAAPEIEQRVVLRPELAGADEIVLTGTRTIVASVTHLDGRPVGDGRIGPAAERMLGVLRASVAASIAPEQARTLHA
jgi:D-alanine transaminase